uniref:Uncharacterized protein n=1 Tax=Ditylenchus dipsaci TaxID=166011 RepID=A0A915EM87_9BILA
MDDLRSHKGASRFIQAPIIQFEISTYSFLRRATCESCLVCINKGKCRQNSNLRNQRLHRSSKDSDDEVSHGKDQYCQGIGAED